MNQVLLNICSAFFDRAEDREFSVVSKIEPIASAKLFRPIFKSKAEFESVIDPDIIPELVELYNLMCMAEQFYTELSQPESALNDFREAFKFNIINSHRGDSKDENSLCILEKSIDEIFSDYEWAIVLPLYRTYKAIE